MLKRSLFNYDLLPIMRSARIAHFVYDFIFNKKKSLNSFYNKIAILFDEVLTNEGRDFFRRSELVGVSNKNKIYNKYFSDKFPIIDRMHIRNMFEKYWDFQGAHIYSKENVRQEFSSISRDIHPFCILSLYFYVELSDGSISQDLLSRFVKNLDYSGISSSDIPTNAENHLHLGGASPTELNILKIINGYSCECKSFDIPNADRDCILFESLNSLVALLGNCSRYLFFKDLFSDSKVSVKDFYGREFQSNRLFAQATTEGLSLLKIPSFILRSIVQNSKDNVNCAFFYYLMYLWSKVYECDKNFEDSLMAYMLIHIVNLLRSYSVMSASTGLEFFTKYFGSPIRKSKDIDISFNSIFNSGTGKLQYRTADVDIARNVEKIVHAKHAFEMENPNADIYANMVYHVTKHRNKKSVNFLEADNRKKIIKTCNKIMNFASSSQSVVKQFQLFSKAHHNNQEITESILEKRAVLDKQIDLMKFLTGLDAAGNEESLSPEVYAPYLRKLASLRDAQEQRAKLIKQFPELYPLRKVFHCGEDFEDIATGLRRIDETVLYLDYNNDDRISHALALGVDPEKWYNLKGDIRISKINLLDNLVWLCHQAEEIGSHSMVPFIMRCKSHIIKLAQELYCSRHFCKENITVENLYKAWELRKNCPLKWQKILSENQVDNFSDALIPDIIQKFDVDGNETIASQLFTYYNNDRDFFFRANEIIEMRVETSPYYPHKDMLKITKDDIDVIRAIQDFKINEYADKGIIIESCPSSNIYIGGFCAIEEHPIFRWNPPIKQWLKNRFNKSGIRKNVIKVCVNTDDPAIFPTNLDNEFILLRNAAIHSRSENDNIEDINEWIEKLRQFNESVFDKTSSHINYQDIATNLLS